MTVHVVATHLESGDVFEATLDSFDYCLVTHGAAITAPRIPGYRPVALLPTLASPPSGPRAADVELLGETSAARTTHTIHGGAT